MEPVPGNRVKFEATGYQIGKGVGEDFSQQGGQALMALT